MFVAFSDESIGVHETNHQEWSEWMIAAGLDGAAGQRGPVLDDPNSLARAAIEENRHLKIPLIHRALKNSRSFLRTVR